MKLKYNGITDVDSWFAEKPPMGKEKQWKDGRSAKELARYMTKTYPSVPDEIEDILLNFTSANSEFEWDAEYITSFEKYGLGRGEGRNHDAMMTNSDIFIGIEGKADESLGKLLADEMNNSSDNKMMRINGMVDMIFGDSPENHKDLRYQLITASAATLLEAKERGLTKALLLVVVFMKDGSYSEAKIARNESDISKFLAETNAVELNGCWKIQTKTDIEFYFRKINIIL